MGWEEDGSDEGRIVVIIEYVVLHIPCRLLVVPSVQCPFVLLSLSRPIGLCDANSPQGAGLVV